MAVSERLKICVSEVKEFDKQYGIYEKEDAPTLSNLIYNALCLAGEGGEVANVVKKIWRDGDSPELREKLEEEIVDVVIYVAKLIIIGQIDFDKAWEKKHKELHERWKKYGANTGRAEYIESLTKEEFRVLDKIRQSKSDLSEINLSADKEV